MGFSMSEIICRDATAEDFDRILALNAAEVQQTSPMNLQRLVELAQLSCFHKLAIVNGHVAAFILAMKDHVPYQNENYAWFSARFTSFVYVDRIVVSSEYAGLKIGSQLYTELFNFARAHGLETICCEYNLQPPNLASKKFHDKFGFKELDTQWLANGAKHVSLQAVNA